MGTFQLNWYSFTRFKELLLVKTTHSKNYMQFCGNFTGWFVKNVRYVATMIQIRTFPPKSAVARSRNLPPVEHISPCYECFDSLRSLSISFSPQLKTCHQARQTYEINLLESCESVSVRTSYFKAIVSRHALARLTITRRLDTRYTSTTWSRRPEEHATNKK